jgi:hypothetical protein
MKFSWNYQERNTSVGNREMGSLMQSTAPALRLDSLHFPKRAEAGATTDGTGKVQSFGKLGSFKPVLLL